MACFCSECKMIIREEDCEKQRDYFDGYGGESTKEYDCCPVCGEPVEEYVEREGDEYEEYVDIFRRD